MQVSGAADRPPADSRILARKAFSESFRLLNGRRSLVGAFYRSLARLVGIAFLATGIILPLAIACKVPLTYAFPALMLITGAISWYLFSTAVGSLIFVSVAHWRGQYLEIPAIRNTIIRRFRAVMFADIGGAISVAVLAISSLIPFFVPRLFAAGNPAGLGALPLAAQIAAAACSAAFGSIVGAYTALAIKNVVFGDVRARVAIAHAHREIRRNAAHRYVIFGVAAALCILSVVQTLYSRWSVANIAAHSINIYSTLIFAVVLGLTASVIWVMQTLPHIWLSQQCDAGAVDDMYAASLAPFEGTVPPSAGVVVRRTLWQVFIYIGIVIVAAIGVGGLLVFTVLNKIAHQNPAEIQATVAKMHVTVPRGYVAAFAFEMPGGLGGQVRTVSLERMHAEKENFSIDITEVEAAPGLAGIGNSTSAVSPAFMTNGNACPNTSGNSRSSITIVSAQQRMIPQTKGPVASYVCTYARHYAKYPNVQYRRVRAKTTFLGWNAHRYAIEAEGVPQLFDTRAVDEIVRKLQNS